MTELNQEKIDQEDVKEITEIEIENLENHENKESHYRSLIRLLLRPSLEIYHTTSTETKFRSFSRIEDAKYVFSL